jgi:hypothetical protein
MERDALTIEKQESTADVVRHFNEEPSSQPANDTGANAPLLARDVADRLDNSWKEIQTGFVDEPRKPVQQADELVATAIKNIAETFARERENLESQWDRQGNVSTEDLRVALKRYRSFFHRLLSV